MAFLVWGAMHNYARAEGIGGAGRVTGAVADSAFFRTGCWGGVKADTQDTSLAGFSVNDTNLGLALGCDWVPTNSSLLLGAMADVSHPYGTLGSDLGVDTSWFVGVRGGVLLSDRLLGYGLLGETWHGIPNSGAFLASNGFTYGAGAELALFKGVFTPTGVITTGIEWRRTDVNAVGPLVVTQDTFGGFLRWRF
jgi:hypothetical protein